MAETPFKLSPWQAVRIAIEYIALAALVYVGIRGVNWLWEKLADTPDSPRDMGKLIVASTLGAVWVTLRAMRRHRGSWALLAVWRVKPIGLFAPYLVLTLGTGIVLSELGNLLETVLPVSAEMRELLGGMNEFALQPWATFFACVVMAPITEEAIFRGIVLRGLLAEIRPWRAIVLSSALFAAVHLNPWQMLGAFGGGLVLGWAYLRTRSLGLCIAGHALHNAIALFATWLPVEISGFNTTPSDGQIFFQPWWLNLAGLLLCVLGAIWFHRAAPPARSFPASGPGTPATPCTAPTGAVPS